MKKQMLKKKPRKRRQKTKSVLQKQKQNVNIKINLGNQQQRRARRRKQLLPKPNTIADQQSRPTLMQLANQNDNHAAAFNPVRIKEEIDNLVKQEFVKREQFTPQQNLSSPERVPYELRDSAIQQQTEKRLKDAKEKGNFVDDISPLSQPNFETENVLSASPKSTIHQFLASQNTTIQRPVLNEPPVTRLQAARTDYTSSEFSGLSPARKNVVLTRLNLHSNPSILNERQKNIVYNRRKK
jgi:hypothetical protein